MAQPVSAAPAVDPRAIQNYRFVAVSSSGVRTAQESGPNTHQTYAEATTKAATLAARTGQTIEIWPAAPPCHNPAGSF